MEAEPELDAKELGSEPIPRLLFHYSVPAIVALVALAAYETVDALFVGQYVGDEGLAVVMLGFPFFMLLHACCNILRVGGTSVTSRFLGAGDRDGATRAIGNILAGLAVFGLIVAVAGFLLTLPILKLCGAPAELMEGGAVYAGTIVLGAPFLFLTFGASSLLRATGHPRKALYIILISCAANVLLDAVFVGLLPWGVFGAAFATVLSQVVGAVYGLAHFMAGDAEYPLKRADFAFSRALLREMLGIGFGYAALELNLIVTMIVTLNMLTAHGGPSALAQNMIVESCIAFLYLPLTGVDEALQPIIGYNFGAGARDRVKAAIRYSLGASLLFLIVALVVIQVGAGVITAFFVDDNPEFQALANRALRIVFMLAPLAAFMFIVPGVLSALGESVSNLILTTVSQIVVQIPALLILPRFFGIDGVWYSFPLYDVVAAALGLFFLLRSQRRNGIA